VILSSHVLAELERTCDYLVILTRGRVRVAESVRQLLDTHRLVSSMEAVPTRAVVGRTLEGEIVVRAERDAARGSRASLEQIVLAYLAGDGWDS
jgi:ABC-2 type transport system ATP-binding protein